MRPARKALDREKVEKIRGVFEAIVHIKCVTRDGLAGRILEYLPTFDEEKTHGT